MSYPVVARRPKTRPRSPIEHARRKLSQARIVRAEHLIAITQGVLEPDDVIDAACSEEGRPLRRIGLKQLLLAQPGWGELRAERVLGALLATLEIDRPRLFNIAWLVDPRARGRRYLAWLDVQYGRQLLWEGFPFSKPASGGV